ncbi:DUF2523 family protein [Pseudomonas syringae]|uniref:DUF2523 domain-containing protein n=1 Tax=Pseudomonas syringae pv. daphniphylli TaxID=264455 RepID=A0A9X0KXM0_PSESX|nr:DUF2523 family protein [Pseudomonas syringae]KPX17684.1 hypothetical protein ALO73_200148 [Pseudomonas syringae pv. daphniphylli]KWS83562.1 hypothetical protein AL050_02905 [Pseudomonas syringae pv. daphniphylli]
MYGVLLAAGMSLIKWLMPRLLAVLGVVVVSETVYTPMLNFLQSKITTSLNGVGAEALSFLNFLAVPQAITIVFAAVTLKISIKGAKSAFAKKASSGA